MSDEPTITKFKPLVIYAGGAEALSVEADGRVMLRGRCVGVDVELAAELTEQGVRLAKVQESMMRVIGQAMDRMNAPHDPDDDKPLAS